MILDAAVLDRRVLVMRRILTKMKRAARVIRRILEPL